jgi:hypothetical protein
MDSAYAFSVRLIIFFAVKWIMPVSIAELGHKVKLPKGEKMEKTFVKSLVAAIMGSLMMVGGASAFPILTLKAGADTVIVDDSIDLITNDGIVNYFGDLGDTTVTFAVGTSYPAIGGFDFPTLHLTAQVTGGIDLVSFELKDTFDFLDDGITSWVTQFGGAGPGAVSLTATLNGVTIANFSEFGPDQFSSYVPTDSPYEFVLSGTIQAIRQQTTSFDANLSPVPEPATMLLFSSGILGLVGICRRKKSQTKG